MDNVQYFSLDCFSSDFWSSLTSLRRTISSSEAPIVLSLSKPFLSLSHLPHNDFNSTFSEGLLFERSEQFINLFHDLADCKQIVIFYSDVCLSGFMAEIALNCDYFFVRNSAVTLQLSRFNGFTPASFLPLKLYRLVGAQSIDWYLNEVKLSYKDLIRFNLCHGLISSRTLSFDAMSKYSKKSLTFFEQIHLRWKMSLCRTEVLKGNEVDPLMQLSFIDLIERMVRFLSVMGEDSFAQYFYECAVGQEYRSGFKIAQTLPCGVMSSLQFTGQYGWERKLILKFIASKKRLVLPEKSKDLYSLLLEMPSSCDDSIHLDDYLSFTQNGSPVNYDQPVTAQNFLGINFLLSN